ncbi:VP7 [Warrego virus]|uniref:Core protein VP7 n=1 Tax=Warrego virus TaxID=40062 RepID=A0A097I4E8_9REOV|nr:VP7 [Warrego virus]AIT55719.1 VP7 [Warrego virus]
MDAIVSRALSVIRACTTLQEVRIAMEAGVLETLGIAINRYNAINQTSVTIRPITLADRNAMFFMCIDMALASLNINVGRISPDYTQRLATIGVLATQEIPYTVWAANEVTRAVGVSQTWGPERQPHGLYTNMARCYAPGRFFLRQNQNVTAVVVSSNIMQVSMNAQAQGDIQDDLVPNNIEPVRVYFVWRRIEVFAGVNGASTNSPNGMGVQVNGLGIRAGMLTAWDGRQPVRVLNPGQGQGMIQIEIVYYTSLEKTIFQVPRMAADIFNIYCFRNPLWNGLRRAILGRTTLPPDQPPMFAPTERVDVLAISLFSALADAFEALQPDFQVFGVIPAAGPLTRAVAQAAYQ